MEELFNPSPYLLQSGDPAPYRINKGNSTTPMLLLCDHASPEVPRSLGGLGLKSESFKRHIAYDIGAKAVATQLSMELDATLILAGYSRLVIDLNRSINHPGSIVEKIDKTPIPANKDLPRTERNKRIEEIFTPYHKGIDQELKRLQRRGTPPIILSIHSFSPDYGETPRPWDIGVLWNRDYRFATPLIKMLESAGLNVGDNEPYSGKHLAYTIDRHAGSAGLANCAIEINQKQILNDTGIRCWVEILMKILPDILKLQQLHRIKWF